MFSKGNFQQMTHKFTIAKLMVILSTNFLNLALNTCCAGKRMCLCGKFWDVSFKKCVKEEILTLLQYFVSPITHLVLRSFSCSKTNTASEIWWTIDLMHALWVPIYPPSLSSVYLLAEEAVEDNILQCNM